MELENHQHKDGFNEIDLMNHNGAIEEVDHPDTPDKDTTDIECGFGPIRPACFQRCANIYTFTFFYSVAGLSTSTLNVYITSQITAIERQFSFSSAESGFLMACNDIGFLATVLFVSYFLRKSHVPRYLSLLTFLFGVSGLVCALPYFLGLETINDPRKITDLILDDNDLTMNSSVSNFNPDYEYMCLSQIKQDIIEVERENHPDNGQHGRHWINTLALVVLASGMILQGAAKSGRSPLVTAYMDNNVEKTRTGTFIGIIAAVGILASSIAFSVATIFSRIYFTLEETDLTPKDPRWIGAWWLGFLVFGITAILSAFPVLLFPNRLPQENTKKDEITMEPKSKRKSPIKFAVDKKIMISKLGKSFKGFFKSTLRLLRRPTYTLMTTATSLKLLGVAGVMAFNAKYLEVQYFLPAWKSNALMGASKLLALSGGTLFGGLLTSKFKLSARGSLAMMAITHLITGVINSFFLMTGCELPPIVGPTSIPFRSPAPNEYIKTQCFSKCSCDEHKFLPVCFNNTITYFSPCFAGCRGKNGTEYIDCTCLPDRSTLTAGFCDTGCDSLYNYIAIAIIDDFIGTMSIVPSYVAYLRIAGDEDKTLAIGMSTFFTSLIGWMSGPVVFGMLVDAACLVWNTTPNGRGSCSLYENADLMNNMFITQICLVFVAAVLTGLALLFQRREEKRQLNIKELQIAEKKFKDEIKF